MKKIVLLFIILLITGCTDFGFRGKVCRSAYRDSILLRRLTYKGFREPRTIEEIDRDLDSLTAKGVCIIIRGADKYCDTIIDHVRYIYTTEKNYDTPVADAEDSALIYAVE